MNKDLCKMVSDSMLSAAEFSQILQNRFLYEGQIRCLDCSNWLGLKADQKEITCPFCKAEYFLGIDGIDAVFYKKKKGKKMVKIKQAEALWSDIIVHHYLKRTKALMDDMAYEEKTFARLSRVKIAKGGQLKADHRGTAWVKKHYPSLIKIYKERIEQIEKNLNASKD